MRGILQVSAGRGVIDGYTVKDRQVVDNMMKEIEIDYEPQIMFKPEIWQKFTVGRSTITGSLDMLEIES